MKLVLLGVVACGPVARAPEPSIAPIAIEVQNVSQDQVTIYVIGRRTRRLGEVEGLSVLTLYVQTSDIRPDGSYRLVAARQFRGPFASSEELSLWRGRSIHLSILTQGIFSSSR
jgi:hypothetical protein